MKKWNEIVFESINNKYDLFTKLVKKHNIKVVPETDDERRKLKPILSNLQKDIEKLINKLHKSKSEKEFENIENQIKNIEEKEFAYSWMIDFAKTFQNRDFYQLKSKMFYSGFDPINVLFGESKEKEDFSRYIIELAEQLHKEKSKYNPDAVSMYREKIKALGRKLGFDNREIDQKIEAAYQSYKK